MSLPGCCRVLRGQQRRKHPPERLCAAPLLQIVQRTRSLLDNGLLQFFVVQKEFSKECVQEDSSREHVDEGS